MKGRGPIGLLLLAGALFVGCGVKAPPVPPRRLPPAPVSDLAGSVAGDAVQLTWGIPAAGDEAGEAEGFAVYRSKTPAGEVECRDCPLIFRQVGRLSVTPSERQAGRKGFSEPLEKGYRYRYKLRAYDAFGAAGDDSNTVTLEY